VSGYIPANLPLPSAQHQNPQIHSIQTNAAVAEPVDAATGYLWYANTLLKENGAQALSYGIYGKFGGLGGVDFGTTYDISIQINGVLAPGTPSITLVQAGRGIHNYYQNGDGNYRSIEFGALYDWIQPVGASEYILHRPDQSQLVFSVVPPTGSQSLLSGYLTSMIN
jgi:hypothetical protein